MHVIPFLCVFILDGALFGDDVKKIVSGLILLYDRRGWGRLLRWDFGVVPAIIYRCNTVPVGGMEKRKIVYAICIIIIYIIMSIVRVQNLLLFFMKLCT